jgi:FtsP/CotA-like multicopper oxidase with cupredoxin domain
MMIRRWTMGAIVLVFFSLLVAALLPAAGLGAQHGAPPGDATHQHGDGAPAAPAPGAPAAAAPVPAVVLPPVTRTYYIAADEVAWDYAPSGINGITGRPFEGDALTFVENGPDRIGKVYQKSVYREYTDATFTTLKPRPSQWRHLGVLGPVIHAIVGDTIKVVFKNRTQFPASVHPHGVFYAKDSEGAGYADGTSGANKGDDLVPPGGHHIYTWQVPERAGPGPMDGSSVLWMYHSHVDEPADTNAGLIGPIIVTKRGMARADGSPIDVDREFVTMFTVFDENASPYLQQNIDTYTGRPATVKPDDEAFHESNLMHSVNGYVFGNLPDLTMNRGQHVRWYVLAQGTEVDLHTPHWHGNTVVINGMRTDVAELLPMSMKIADMVPDDPGVWLFHCHVNDHITAGMLALFTVR